jgi:hypothetical protein
VTIGGNAVIDAGLGEDVAAFDLLAGFRAGALRAAGAAFFVVFLVWAMEQFSSVAFKSTESTLADPLQVVITAVRNHNGLLGGVPGRVFHPMPPISVPQANRSQGSKPMLLNLSRKDLLSPPPRRTRF